MNVEIGAEAALFPEKEYIIGISFGVYFVFCQLNDLLSANVYIIHVHRCSLFYFKLLPTIFIYRRTSFLYTLQSTIVHFVIQYCSSVYSELAMANLR
jgi:hypothetical protein